MPPACETLSNFWMNDYFSIFRDIILMTTCVLCTLYSINKLNKFLCDVGLLCNANIYIVIHYSQK
jgi:hypothetical protein